MKVYLATTPAGRFLVRTLRLSAYEVRTRLQHYGLDTTRVTVRHLTRKEITAYGADDMRVAAVRPVGGH